MPLTTVTLIGKPGCHLCDDARQVLNEVITELGARDRVELKELSILDDPELHELYAEEIPVVLINGAVHTIWRVNPARLRVALSEESP